MPCGHDVVPLMPVASEHRGSSRVVWSPWAPVGSPVRLCTRRHLWCVLAEWRQTMRTLKLGELLDNSVSGQAFRIEEFLGKGGFGAAYLAQPLTRGGRKDGEVICLKLTDDPGTWHGEAYFGGLLRAMPNVVKQIDAFPTTLVDKGGR